MKCAIVLLALAAFGAALPQQQQQQQKQQAADQDLLKKQQDVILLLQQITQEIPNEQLQILGTTYDIQNNIQQYENPILVQYYVGAVQAGLVQPKGTAYSSSISQLRKEVSLLYRILLGTKNYPTLLATAAWARVHVNEQQFLKAFIGAVLQHPETQGVVLPPLYEIIPQYYFDARIIQEAQNIAVQGVSQGVAQGYNQVVIPVNYSAQLSNSEQQLSYFTQDVGLANYYGLVNLAGYLLPHGQQTPAQQQGIQNQESQIGQGSIYYYLHQQLLAHYELNRLSNGLGPIQDIDYDNVQAPYQPHLRHTNGLEFPGRPQNLQLSPKNDNLIQTVRKIEQRLIEAIDSGHVITPQAAFLSLYQPQGLNILGELIQGTGRSVNPRYYGSLQAAARQLLGNAPEAQNIYDYTPSVVELGQVAVRDPVFYQLYQNVIQLFKQYQNSLPAYQYNDILLPGVSIQDVQISPLVTLFNNYYVDLDAITQQQVGQQQVGQQHQVQQQQQQQQLQQQQQQQQHQQQQQQHIQAQVKRLDHKPYEYQITVQSEQNVPDAVVRVYLGPKYDYNGKPISISQHRHQFVELDQFITNLQQGQNVIVRQSQQAPGQSHDWPSVQEIQQGVNNAINAQEPYYITQPQQLFGFPARLALPKGQQGQGLPVQLLVVISQPGQQNVPYGPVVPEQYQTYAQGQYQVVGTEDYQQIQHQAGKVVGVKQTVEVVPETLPINQQQNQVVRNHVANLYTQQHGQYPYTHSQYQVGQGQGYNVYGVQGQHGQQGQWGQQGQHGQNIQGQQQWSQHQGIYQGQQGQNQHGQQSTVGVQSGVPIGVHGLQQGIHGIQGVQSGVQGLQGLQGIQGVQGVQGAQYSQENQGVQSGIQHGIQGKYPVTYQGQSQQQQGLGVGYTGSGQYHAGGFQNILGQGQGQKTQDASVSQYYQNKHISEIIGGAISLDGKPLGYPLDRPLTPGALSVPNLYVQTVHIQHEGQPTNEVQYQ
ncbi:hexamerin 110 [Temnothorax americanus]|uniref:hexamerin 110 n=1 Tax=Temnothorax americanus TaxID=1964332 RepID=UPI0040695D30